MALFYIRTLNNIKRKGGSDMDSEKVISVVEMYKERLRKEGIPKIRMDLKQGGQIERDFPADIFDFVAGFAGR